jgi:hypothetical protein
MAAKATEPLGDPMSRPYRRILRKVGVGQRSQIRDEIVDLDIEKALAPDRHPFRRGVERLSEL